MDAHLLGLLGPYNPWFGQGDAALGDTPEFHRPVFDELLRDLAQIQQILSITGPRRIGKTTLLRQIVRHFLRTGTKAESLIYYSFDDPALLRPRFDKHAFFDSLMREASRTAQGGQKALVLLDEIQRLESWELYLKKYYDLDYPIRFVVSGSASSPIFKKSRESLLGRVKDFHLLPFSFREFLLKRSMSEPDLVAELDALRDAGIQIMGMLAGDPRHFDLQQVPVPKPSDHLWAQAQLAFADYLRDGGFPEVWAMESWENKVEYLYDNQVKKVIFEDLVLAAEFRKPEQLKRFYISLLERPGREVNFTKLNEETAIATSQVDKYVALLELTDLLTHIGKFRKSPLRVRRGSVKFYLVDLALRNAVLRLENVTTDPDTLGLYAENLVFNALRKSKGTIAIDYYREKRHEVDFVVHFGPRKYLPVEVKYRDTISNTDIAGAQFFQKRFRSIQPIVVTKTQADFGQVSGTNVFRMPLMQFLLVFD